MTAIGREEAQVEMRVAASSSNFADRRVDMTVAFMRAPAGMDLLPLLVGLPDDLCQCRIGDMC